VVRRDDDLLSQIEREALDDSVSLASVLRKCVVLGGKSGSERLQEWATRELEGYYGQGDLPSYRIIRAPLVMDGLAGGGKITGQQLSEFHLPEFAREHISEELQMRDGVGALEALLDQDEIRLSPLGGAEVLAIMNSESDRPGQYIERIYWKVSPAAVRGVLDYVRTALAKLRANMGAGEEVPSADVANEAVHHAVNVHVTEDRSKVTVAAPHASGARSTATIGESGSWPLWQKVIAVIGVLAAVAGVVFAAIQAL
jgi:hypothetical protein